MLFKVLSIIRYKGFASRSSKRQILRLNIAWCIEVIHKSSYFFLYLQSKWSIGSKSDFVCFEISKKNRKINACWTRWLEHPIRADLWIPWPWLIPLSCLLLYYDLIDGSFALNRLQELGFLCKRVATCPQNTCSDWNICPSYDKPTL